ncbi:MAG: acyl-CoA reductase [Crocinitomicaceae bacterium]|nr:acyl-CoA reductase [Crocinitomicaceae bacterium]
MPISLQQRSNAFVQLGKICTLLSENSEWPGFDSGMTREEYNAFQVLIEKQVQYNGWFTSLNVRMALRSWGIAMEGEKIRQWSAPYFDDKNSEERSVKTIAVICAGNIPMVGFHDILSVLISGNRALIKLSSDDSSLIPSLLQLLIKLEPGFENTFRFADGKLTGFDAVIATGSTNTSRYFEYYFRSVPHIIRRGRTGIAILDGTESSEELGKIGHDLFDYFGLGCRNVTKIYVPENYRLDTFFEAIYPFHPIVNHNKYANNYDYNKAVWLLNNVPLLDNGFLLLKEDNAVYSPTGSLFYERYTDENALRTIVEKKKSELQCIIGRKNVPLGQSQYPELWDYADGVDTMSFLTTLHNR